MPGCPCVQRGSVPEPNGGGRSQLTNCGQPATGIDGGGDGTDIEHKFVSQREQKIVIAHADGLRFAFPHDLVARGVPATGTRPAALGAHLFSSTLDGVLEGRALPNSMTNALGAYGELP